MTETKSWHQYFMEMALLVSSKSKDRSTRVGAILVGEGNIVLGVGYNGFPRGVNDNAEDRHERPDKYLWTEHAERNAIFSAARHGVKVGGSKIYVSGRGFPCAECARAIIQTGIVEVITCEGTFEGKGSLWERSMVVSGIMLMEAKVKITFLDEKFQLVV